MESMESDFTDIENGGVFEKSLIPELTKLANENISVDMIIQSYARKLIYALKMSQD